jgi:hypothetical protein
LPGLFLSNRTGWVSRNLTIRAIVVLSAIAAVGIAYTLVSSSQSSTRDAANSIGTPGFGTDRNGQVWASDEALAATTTVAKISVQQSCERDIEYWVPRLGEARDVHAYDYQEMGLNADVYEAVVSVATKRLAAKRTPSPAWLAAEARGWCRDLIAERRRTGASDCSWCANLDGETP